MSPLTGRQLRRTPNRDGVWTEPGILTYVLKRGWFPNGKLGTALAIQPESRSSTKGFTCPISCRKAIVHERVLGFDTPVQAANRFGSTKH